MLEMYQSTTLLLVSILVFDTTASDQAKGGRKVLGLPALTVIHKGHHSVILDVGGRRKVWFLYPSS